MLQYIDNIDPPLYKPRAYTYLVDTTFTRTVTPIDINDLKPHSKIDYTEPDEDTYLSFLIDSAIDAAEKFTNRSFINQRWITYRDLFTNEITLERGSFATLYKFEYKNTDSVWVTVDPTLYYVAVKNPYSQIIFTEDSTFPDDIIDQQNSIRITFVAGYGTTKASVPATLRYLLMQHVTWLYENKGNVPIDGLNEGIKREYEKYFRVVDI